jgi:hypothetical protein
MVIAQEMERPEEEMALIITLLYHDVTSSTGGKGLGEHAP